MSHSIAGGDFHLERDAFGRLTLIEANGTKHVGVEPVRGFPISDPLHGLSVCDADGQELLWIDDVSKLKPEVRALLEEELSEREFVPRILKILSVSAATNPCEWEVETDRGPTKFLVKSEDNVRRLDAKRALVTDAHGTRYLIADSQSLDRSSRRILERYL